MITLSALYKDIKTVDNLLEKKPNIFHALLGDLSCTLRSQNWRRYAAFIKDDSWVILVTFFTKSSCLAQSGTKRISQRNDTLAHSKKVAELDSLCYWYRSSRKRDYTHNYTIFDPFFELFKTPHEGSLWFVWIWHKKSFLFIDTRWNFVKFCKPEPSFSIFIKGSYT